MTNVWCLIIWLSLFPAITSYAQGNTLGEIRHEFYLSTLDYKYASPLLEKLQLIRNPNALELGYKAATEAIMAKPGWNIFRKMAYLRRSRESFNQAVRIDSRDLEIRFLRLSVEHHIPRYLGFSANMASDKQLIVDNIEMFEDKELPQEIADYIILFSVECGLYTQEELDKLKQLLDD